MLKKGSSGGILIHPWDITEEGIDTCLDYLGGTCGLNEVVVASVYHASTFLLPHNPRRMVRWDDGSAFFRSQHPCWQDTRIRPVVGDCVDTSGYLHNIVDNARKRGWGVLFFVVFHFSHSLARAYPDACCVDAMGERSRSALCPSNPDVRAYDLALVREMMETYGGDGIRRESLGFDPWNYGFVVNKAPVPPPPRDQFLLGLCFCGSCLQGARQEGLDPLPLRREVRAHLYGSLSRPPEDWGTEPADEVWARSAFDGALWRYLEMRCNTVTSLSCEVLEVINQYGGAFMPFGTESDRQVLEQLDYSRFYPDLKRVSPTPRGSTLQDRRACLVDELRQVPRWAEADAVHRPLGHATIETFREEVLMTRELGVRHHLFDYYGWTPRSRLRWIGEVAQAWE